MSSRVGILTFHRAYNLGAVLQAFALQRTISALGSQCSIVDYIAPDEETSYPWFRLPLNRGALAADLLLLLNLKAHLRSRRRYEDFRAKRLVLTPRSYHSLEELKTDGPGYDRYVSGSDQIWHPAMLDRPGGAVFFQDFVQPGKRVAYGPSFGLSEIPAHLRERARERIQRFDFLSAREDDGCKIIDDLTGRSAEHVVDPSLLRTSSDYAEVAVDPPRFDPYILVYAMDASENLRTLVASLRDRLKLPVMIVVPWFVAPWRWSGLGTLVYDAGPAEFLGWVKGAAFVCTNSFHGTCFSVIYRRPFLTASPAHGNARTRSLLTLLGLPEREVRGPANEATVDALLQPIDFSGVAERLAMAVQKSRAYLHRALA